jgi:hypothetical protein
VPFSTPREEAKTTAAALHTGHYELVPSDENNSQAMNGAALRSVSSGGRGALQTQSAILLPIPRDPFGVAGVASALTMAILRGCLHGYSLAGREEFDFRSHFHQVYQNSQSLKWCSLASTTNNLLVIENVALWQSSRACSSASFAPGV